MIEKADYVLYGVIGVFAAVVVFIAYRIYKNKGETKPENHVMNKIEDFYSLQDRPNKPDINY